MNKSGTEIDVLRSTLLTFALRMQDNPWKLRKKDRHLLQRKLSFFSNARRSTLVAWKSRVDAALSLATDCLSEVGSDIGQYQIPKSRNERKPPETINMSNTSEQPQKSPYQSPLQHHMTASVCDPTFLPSKLDYYDVGSTCKTNSSSINSNLTNFNISYQPHLHHHTTVSVSDSSPTGRLDYYDVGSTCKAHSSSINNNLTNIDILKNGKLNFHVGGSSCHTTFSNDTESPITRMTKLRNKFRSNNAQGDRLARRKKICVNKKIKIFENVRTTPTYGATDKFGHKFPWVKSEKKWRQTISTAQIVLEKNVKSVTSDIEQLF